jgi:hypothetical protein
MSVAPFTPWHRANPLERVEAPGFGEEREGEHTIRYNRFALAGIPNSPGLETSSSTLTLDNAGPSEVVVFIVR